MNINDYLKKSYIQIKDNLVMIALIPTILGGLWQLLNLGRISITMIRFFSISQLISDGLIILLFLALPAFAYIILFSNQFDKWYDEESLKLSDVWRDFKNDKLVVPRTFLFVAIIASTIISNSVFEFNSVYNFAILFTAYFIMITVILVLSFNFLKRNYLFEIYIAITCLFSVLVAIYTMNKTYQMTNNISNFNSIIQNLEKKECYSTAPKILYFNDKYIFIELQKKNKKSILIKQIDDLFEN